MTRNISGHLKYWTALLFMGFFCLGIPIYYMIREYRDYGGPYMLSYPLFGVLLMLGLMFTGIVWIYYSIWLEETSRSEKGKG